MNDYAKYLIKLADEFNPSRIQALKELDETERLAEIGRATLKMFKYGYTFTECDLDYDYEENSIETYRNIAWDEDSLLRYLED